MHQFNFTVGDWSDDGHGHSETFLIKSSHSVSDVIKAYKVLNDKLPQFDRWFEEYEESTISVSDYEALIALDPAFAKFFDKSETKKMSGTITRYHLEDGPDGYAKLWIALLKQFTPELELSIVPNRLSTINGGGYGLFWS